MIEVPRSFRDQPRWWGDGGEWLTAVPSLLEEQCRRWGLEVDGAVRHGSQALVVPVRRSDEGFVLRLQPSDDDVAAEVAALEFWDGRGTVRLVQADIERGVMLLERLDGSRSLQQLPVQEGAAVLAQMMCRLAVPAPAGTPSTAGIAQQGLADFPDQWRLSGRPFSASTLALALGCAAELSSTRSTVAVNGDLHYEQVLAGTREEWLCVDPVLLCGDVEYDVGRVLWYRLDELADEQAVRDVFRTVVETAQLDADRALAWVVFRCVEYWLWGLEHNLTHDPPRCARLVQIFGRS